ncbi:MAG: SMP-30/gluconolactonase/LRE family protein [Pirellulaceae bacterium]
MSVCLSDSVAVWVASRRRGLLMGVVCCLCVVVQAGWARAQTEEDDRAKELLRTFADEFVELSPGTDPFPPRLAYGRMADRPGTPVVLPRSFKIGTVEVPQNLWEEVMGHNPSRWKGPRNSVEMLSFDDAVEFCHRITQRLRDEELIAANELVRLPTEVEWEYAARAGGTGDYTFGNDLELLDDHAWHTGNAAGNDPPVAAKLANAWGLYDVHGYLWEWCLPTDDANDPPGVDRPEWAKGFTDDNGVLRGGSWKDRAVELRLAVRRQVPRSTRDDAVGLRCVMVPERGAQPVKGFEPTDQNRVVPAGRHVEWLWNQGEFTEGPVAIEEGEVLFSDIGDRTLRIETSSGKVTVAREPSGRGNGMAAMPDGRIAVAEGANTGGGRRISIGRIGQEFETLAESLDGKRFNSPNDLVADQHGGVYFTDPRYVGDEPRELEAEAVYYVSPTGEVSLATDDVTKPNGIVLSPDGTTAYVADHAPDGPRTLLKFQVTDEHRLVNPRVLFDFGTSRGIDGMAVNERGEIFATAGGGDEAGIYVFSGEGRPLAFIPTPGAPTNCTFGRGSEAAVLYITGEGPKPTDPAEPRRYGIGRIDLRP